MATTTATLSIVSADLTSDALSLSNTKNLNAAGVATGLSQVEGVARKRLAGDSSNAQNYVIADASNAKFTEDGAAKLYIKNLSTSNAEYLVVLIGEASGSTGGYNGQEIGRLYGGDFMFIPWSADTTNTDSDIMVQTPANSLNQEVEYLIIFE
jgi:hypothetical protein